MKLMALVMPSTHTTLSRYDQFESRTNVLMNGMRSERMLIPENTSTLAASTIPDILAGADTSRRSSMAPTARMTTAAITSPSGSVLLSNTELNASSRQATAMPTRKPRSMPMPPRVGVGRVWTRRSSGRTTAPILIASRRTSGTSTRVVTVTTARTSP